MSRTRSSALPPGPPLPKALQAALILRFWPRFVAACQRRYGSVFALSVSSLGTLIYLDDPADIKAVFAGDPTIYHAGEANSMLSGLLGDSSVLVVDDDVHRDRRRLMLSAFHRDAVARQSDLMAEIAAENISKWPVGQTFPVAPQMAQITLEIILRTVIGATDPTRLAALREVLPRLLRMGPVDTLAIANPRLQSRRPWRGLRRRIEEADRLLYAEIADRRTDPDTAKRTDVLAMLVRSTADDGPSLTDIELRDQLMTLLVAGHDTTATGLSWTLERLSRHPEALHEAVLAARSSALGDPAGDEYLDAVAKESLRVRPVVFDVGRVLTEPVDVAGYRIPAGVMIVPGIGLVHARSDIYPDPSRFDPSRMFGSDLTPTTWLPFGGGNRRCLGATFALTEMRIVLREVLRQVDLGVTTAKGERQRVRHVILEPHRGARIRVREMHDVPPATAAAMAPTCPVATTSAPGMPWEPRWER